MMYPRSLADDAKYLIELKEQYGYDNVIQFEYGDISEVEWIQMHLVTPVKNLKFGLEIKLAEEDYETADLITKIIKFIEGEDQEIVFPLTNTEGKTKFIVKKK